MKKDKQKRSDDMIEPKHIRGKFEKGYNILAVHISDISDGSKGLAQLCNLEQLKTIKKTPDYCIEFYSIQKCCDFINENKLFCI